MKQPPPSTPLATPRAGAAPPLLSDSQRSVVPHFFSRPYKHKENKLF